MRYEHHEGGIPTIEMDPEDYSTTVVEDPRPTSEILARAWEEMGGEG